MKIRIDKRDRVFSLIIRTRDSWTCQRCFKVFTPPTMALHCSHYFGRANVGTRWCKENCEALCYGCHAYLTANPDEHRARKIRLLGEQGFIKLQYLARTPTHYGKTGLELLYHEMVKEAKAMRIKL